MYIELLSEELRQSKFFHILVILNIQITAVLANYDLRWEFVLFTFVVKIYEKQLCASFSFPCLLWHQLQLRLAHVRSHEFNLKSLPPYGEDRSCQLKFSILEGGIAILGIECIPRGYRFVQKSIFF